MLAPSRFVCPSWPGSHMICSCCACSCTTPRAPTRCSLCCTHASLTTAPLHAHQLLPRTQMGSRTCAATSSTDVPVDVLLHRTLNFWCQNSVNPPQLPLDQPNPYPITNPSLAQWLCLAPSPVRPKFESGLGILSPVFFSFMLFSYKMFKFISFDW